MAILPLSQLKILHKGLFIVLLPSLINAALVLTLESSLDRAHNLMQASRRQSIIVDTLTADTLVVTGILSVGNNAIMNGAMRNLKHVLDPYFAKLSEDVNRLAPEMPEELQFDRTRRDILKTIDSQRAFLVQINNSKFAMDSLLIKLTRTKPWLKLCGSESTLLNQSLSQAQEAFRKSLSLQKEEQQHTALIVGITLIFNAGLAVLLAILFQRDISDRIAVVVRSARQISKHETLTEQVEGQDEIAGLYRDLQVAGQDLRENETFRRSVMQMMAHDVRSPLMASTISLEVIDKGAGGAFKPQSKKLVDAIRQRMQYCLNLINDLLQLESLENKGVETKRNTENLQALLKAAVQKAQEQARLEGIDCVIDVAQLLVVVDGDQIAEAFDRLLARALKEAVLGSTLKIAAIADGQNVLLTISHAISPDPDDENDAFLTDADIFDKYRHLAAPGKLEGDALSLPVANRLLEASGCRIERRGGETGVIYRITLPGASQTAEATTYGAP
ncbi:MAG: HAMP domain-containing histidine kinase [Cyanobacteria bacterium REEB67]|nr:HAMP domain-containing histidine kinase [Cyanobacteria bacterium REEB67]